VYTFKSLIPTIYMRMTLSDCRSCGLCCSLQMIHLIYTLDYLTAAPHPMHSDRLCPDHPFCQSGAGFRVWGSAEKTAHQGQVLSGLPDECSGLGAGQGSPVDWHECTLHQSVSPPPNHSYASDPAVWRCVCKPLDRRRIWDANNCLLLGNRLTSLLHLKKRQFMNNIFVHFTSYQIIEQNALNLAKHN
jgi:hypothetical protein